ncbi:synaptonemal complex central element protein 1-like [Engystomops pustulosus]|uniref:synaptonemal complex central element protein 1-like n=1 Tax=Engystomops pustulosus TaxID=76066 RepID=UPI003AFA4233
METLLRQIEEMREDGDMDPKMMAVLKKISLAQKDQEQTEAEKQELDKEMEAAQSELQKLYAEKATLKETLVKKQENVRILKLQRDEQLKKEKKQQEQMEETKKGIDDLTNKIKEEKLKQRTQRLDFQDNLEDVMKKHKALAEFYDAKRIEAEIEQIIERKKELLKEEKEKLANLEELKETEARLRQEGALTPENLFLHSEQATYAIKLFEEENQRAKVLLEEATLRKSEVLEKYNRLKSELEDAEKKQIKVSEAPVEAPQPETIRGASLSSSILLPSILFPMLK